jgi:hypothetical protein
VVVAHVKKKSARAKVGWTGRLGCDSFGSGA